MSDLRARSRRSAHLAVPNPTDVVHVEILRGDQVPHTLSLIIAQLPAHTTAVSKTMPASVPRRALGQVVGAGLPRTGPRTPTTPRAPTRELERTHRVSALDQNHGP
ncbi:IclR family transcriptional regulator domain-containing protein [Streptomyces canus]